MMSNEEVTGLNCTIVFRSSNFGIEEIATPFIMANNTQDNIFFKIKSTCEKMFTAEPLTGYVSSNTKRVVNLVYKPDGPLPGDKVHFYTLKCISSNETTEKAVSHLWNQINEESSLHRLYITFKKEKTLFSPGQKIELKQVSQNNENVVGDIEIIKDTQSVEEICEPVNENFAKQKDSSNTSNKGEANYKRNQSVIHVIGTPHVPLTSTAPIKVTNLDDQLD